VVIMVGVLPIDHMRPWQCSDRRSVEMSFSRMPLVLCIATVACLPPTIAEATLIDVQVLGQSDGNPTLPLNYSGAAVAGTAGDVWNGYVVDSKTNGEYSPAAISLSDSTGVGTSLTFQTSAVNGDNQAYVGLPGQSSNGLINSYAYKATPATFTISGLLANSPYELYVYGGSPGNWTGYSMSVSVGGDVKTMSSATTFDSTGFSEGVNYAHYASVTSDGVGTIVGMLAPNGGNGYIIFNGVQIRGAIPEPSTLCLLVCGLLGLMAYACRKRW
jgi:hypothetical protein